MTGVHLFLSLVDQRLLTYRILIEYLLCFTVNQLYIYFVTFVAILEIFECNRLSWTGIQNRLHLSLLICVTDPSSDIW